jgi:pyruvate dehydrogenase E1 component alpha subunit
MILIREAEEMVSTLFLQGRLPGFIHSYVGEEATAVGVCSALRQDDYITSTHRGHGHILAKGGDLERFFAELFGKETGYCHGKGGSMHVADLDLGILGANGIVGGGIPIAGGAALAAQMQGLDRVAVSFLGDGAINTGPFHEALNLAAVWELPVVFVCENNGYANFIAFRRHTRIDQISERAAAYGMSGVTVDGNDVEAVYSAALEAVERARSGQGPTLLECLTYRWHGHYEGDPEAYRTEEEVAEWKARDPLGVVERRLEAAGALAEEAKQAIWDAVRQQIEDAVAFAEESPLPVPESALEGVYTDILEEGWA